MLIGCWCRIYWLWEISEMPDTIARTSALWHQNAFKTSKSPTTVYLLVYAVCVGVMSKNITLKYNGRENKHLIFYRKIHIIKCNKCIFTDYICFFFRIWWSISLCRCFCLMCHSDTLIDMIIYNKITIQSHMWGCAENNDTNKVKMNSF